MSLLIYEIRHTVDMMQNLALYWMRELMRYTASSLTKFTIEDRRVQLSLTKFTMEELDM